MSVLRTARLDIAGAPYQLESGKLVNNVISVYAPPTNATPVFIAGSPSACQSPPSRFAIAVGNWELIHVSELSLLWVWGGTVGDNLDFICEVE